MKMRKIKSITYRSSDSKGEPIPCIIIQGKFLNQYGFKLGKKTEIEYSKNKITIALIKTKTIKLNCLLDKDERSNLVIVGAVVMVLNKNGFPHKANEFVEQALKLKSNQSVLELCKQYVKINLINKKQYEQNTK